MKQFTTALARFMLKGYSLVLLLVLWLVSISVNASGGVAMPMYGVIAEYGVPVPLYGAPAPYGCTITWNWDKAQDTAPNSIAGDIEYER
jgi:hypothetical protein